ncbi:MAG TPA: alpha-amylase family glycosyl hydrolase, partial [Candidatus Dormibacteraeota bacterium]|nr:alpha-amylase family glycosyl hydrolase [Candidatus Dormibacteraeota bacterium]
MNPRATYRVQLSADFPCEQAAALSDYFQALGISHLYCSPVLQAAPGSTHGYDVADPSHISAEIGGAAAFRQMSGALNARSIGVIVDIVPNHMATAGRANPWWWDLLARGRSSSYADYFDVDWRPAATTLKDKILLGVLGDRYGRELEAHALTIAGAPDDVVVRYHEQEFPIAPGTLDGAQPDRIGADIDQLDRLLDRQHYRLAFWRSAQEELNYRRFFTVDTLIGLRVEQPQVFADSHHLILDLVADGHVSGLRVDHVDGLRNPAAYLTRLKTATSKAYIVVEKILATG